jgi:type VI secretion system protein ImpL
MEIVALRSLEQSVEILRVLSDKELSPMRRLLESVSFQTQLEKSDDSATKEALEKQGKKLIGKVTRRFQRFFSDVDLTKGQSVEEAPEAFVSRRFSQLHSFVATADDAPPVLDKLLDDLNRLFFFMKAVMAASDSGKGDTFVEGVEIKEIKSIAEELPPPLNEWMRTVGQDVSNLIAGGARAHINNIWTAEILPFCREAIHDRYPIARRSTRETTVHDFGKLFGSGGLIDSFFQENLAKFVDTTKEPWQWRGDGLGISDDALAQFQLAASIRDSFFVSGGTSPSATFEMKPLTMGQDVKQFLLDLEGQIVDYQHGPPQISKLQWPGPDGPGRVRLVFVHKYGSRPSINEEGPWAWFRVLDRSRVTRGTQPELFRIAFSISDEIADMSASFEVRATSVRNPFNLDQLRQFSCPARL